MVFKIGSIGAGGIAQLHMKKISTMADVEMTAICDIASEKAKEAAKLNTVVEVCKARILAAMEDNAVGLLPGIGQQYKRSQVNRKSFTVDATSYYQCRSSAIPKSKS